MHTYEATCRCGSVVFHADGAPLASLSCYCSDCQAGAKKVAALEGGLSGMDADGGTPLVLFRKDQVRCVRGRELLRPYNPSPSATTDRWVASCCNTAMGSEFRNWFPQTNFRRATMRADAPPLEMRIFTKQAPDSPAIPSDVPSYRGVQLGLVWTLLSSKLALAFAPRSRRMSES